MKNSLKLQLNNLIKQKGYMTYWEIKDLVEGSYFGGYHQMDTAKRILRPSLSPNIQEHKNDKGVVVGYRYKQQEEIKPPVMFNQVKLQTNLF